MLKIILSYKISRRTVSEKVGPEECTPNMKFFQLMRKAVPAFCDTVPVILIDPGVFKYFAKDPGIGIRPSVC